MVENELIKDEDNAYDELIDEDTKSPKRAKKEIKHDASSPDVKPKRPRARQT